MPHPLFLFAFANDADKSLRLKDEERVIRGWLWPLHQKEMDFQTLGNTELSDLHDAFNTFHNQIVLFHYGGHSDQEKILLEDVPSKRENLSKLLGIEANLKLVFLNGCSNAAQVRALHKAGVKAVIATSAPVDDRKASTFAEAFYKGLAGKKSIRNAFESAVSKMEDIGNFPETKIRGFDLDDHQNRPFPWGLYAAENADLDWSLGRVKKSFFWRPKSELGQKLLIPFAMVLAALIGMYFLHIFSWEYDRFYKTLIGFGVVTACLIYGGLHSIKILVGAWKEINSAKGKDVEKTTPAKEAEKRKRINKARVKNAPAFLSGLLFFLLFISIQGFIAVNLTNFWKITNRIHRSHTEIVLSGGEKSHGPDQSYLILIDQMEPTGNTADEVNLTERLYKDLDTERKKHHLPILVARKEEFPNISVDSLSTIYKGVYMVKGSYDSKVASLNIFEKSSYKNPLEAFIQQFSISSPELLEVIRKNYSPPQWSAEVGLNTYFKTDFEKNYQLNYNLTTQTKYFILGLIGEIMLNEATNLNLPANRDTQKKAELEALLTYTSSCFEIAEKSIGYAVNYWTLSRKPDADQNLHHLYFNLARLHALKSSRLTFDIQSQYGVKLPPVTPKLIPPDLIEELQNHLVKAEFYADNILKYYHETKPEEAPEVITKKLIVDLFNALQDYSYQAVIISNDLSRLNIQSTQLNLRAKQLGKEELCEEINQMYQTLKSVQEKQQVNDDNLKLKFNEIEDRHSEINANSQKNTAAGLMLQTLKTGILQAKEQIFENKQKEEITKTMETLIRSIDYLFGKNCR